MCECMPQVCVRYETSFRYRIPAEDGYTYIYTHIFFFFVCVCVYIYIYICIYWFEYVTCSSKSMLIKFCINLNSLRLLPSDMSAAWDLLKEIYSSEDFLRKKWGEGSKGPWLQSGWIVKWCMLSTYFSRFQLFQICVPNDTWIWLIQVNFISIRVCNFVLMSSDAISKLAWIEDFKKLEDWSHFCFKANFFPLNLYYNTWFCFLHFTFALLNYFVYLFT